jgi:hypothetical protein
MKKTKDFAASIQQAVDWAETDVAELDPDFAEWFLERLLHTPALIEVPFVTDFNHEKNVLTIDSILTICCENWLDSVVLRDISLFHQHLYGHGGEILFADPLLTESGFRWSTGEGHIRAGRAKSLYAVIHMVDHWGVAHFDFLTRKISFGDSLRRDAPLSTLRKFVDWLEPLTGTEDSGAWRSSLKEILLFPVPLQQDRGRGSCGVMASISIEQAVNSHFDWNDQRYHSALSLRIRYLRLLSGCTNVSLQIVFRTGVFEGELFSLT